MNEKKECGQVGGQWWIECGGMVRSVDESTGGGEKTVNGRFS